MNIDQAHVRTKEVAHILKVASLHPIMIWDRSVRMFTVLLFNSINIFRTSKPRKRNNNSSDSEFRESPFARSLLF